MDEEGEDMIYIKNSNQVDYFPTIINFPNSEVKIDIPLIGDVHGNLRVFLRFESNNDLINLMIVKRHLDQLANNIELYVDYFPYSRMDRSEGMTCFSLKYISEFINWLSFKKVFIKEPHSDVTSALIDRIKINYPTIDLYKYAISYLEGVFPSVKNIVYYPDAGSEKRYSKLLHPEFSLSGNKTRDFETGKITNLEIIGEVPKEPFNIIMVDDLCSRGGTFIMAAEKLKPLGANQIHLVVTHCENTIFDGDIIKTDLIDRVHTTNSILDYTRATKEGRDKIIVTYGKGEKP